MFESILVIFAIFILPFMAGCLLSSERQQAWLSGLLLIGMTVSICHGWGLNQLLAYGIIIGFSIIGCFRFIARKPRLPVVNFYGLLTFLIVAFLLTFCWSEVINTPLDQNDATHIWYNKAQHIYFWKPLKEIASAAYPNLGASLWASTLKIIAFQEQFGRLLFPTTYVFLIVALLQVKIRSSWGRLIFLGNTAALSISLLNPGIWNGYQDFFLATVAANAAFLLARIANKRSIHHTQDLLLAAFFLGNLYLIKNEGLILAAIIVFAFCLSLILHGNLPELIIIINKNRIATATGLILLLGIPLMWLMTLISTGTNPSEVQGDAFTLSGILKIPMNLERIDIILEYLRHWISEKIWLIGPAIFISMANIVLITRMRLTNVFLWFSILIHTLFITTVFLATNADINWHLRTAFDRLMDQHCLIYLVVFAINLTELLDKYFSLLELKVSQKPI